MNTRSILFVTVLAVATWTAFAQESTRFSPQVLKGTLTPKALANTDLKTLSVEIAKVEQAVIDNGCDTNLCFALQGGSGVTDDEFLEQKNFIDLVLQIIGTDREANYAGAQYADEAFEIASLDSRRGKFLRRLARTSRKTGGTKLVAGIRYCAKQIRPKREDLDKMVLLSNGFATIGDDQVDATRRFLREGGHICAIAVGETDKEALLEMTQTEDRILELDQWFELSEIIVGLISQVCGFP